MRYGWLVLVSISCSTPEVEKWEPGTPWEWEDEPHPTSLMSDLVQPVGLCMGGSGDLWVADPGQDSVLRISPSGEITARIDSLWSPQWVACGVDTVLVTESDEAGRVLLFDTAGEPLHDLTPNGANWGRAVYGNGVYSWFAVGGTSLFQWDGSSVSSIEQGGVVRALTATAEGVVMAIGAQAPWRLLDESGAQVGTTQYAPQDLAWNGHLWASTRSARWPFGGWVVRFDGSEAGELVSYSPPEPGPIAVTDNAVFWGSKQTLTRLSLGSETYEALALQTAVGDVVASEQQVFWTDRQRGVLLTWTD